MKSISKYKEDINKMFVNENIVHQVFKNPYVNVMNYAKNNEISIYLISN